MCVNSLGFPSLREPIFPYAERVFAFGRAFARNGGKPGLQIEPELVLYGPDGSESAACRRIYHRQE